jgi:hypothetical protein
VPSALASTTYHSEQQAARELDSQNQLMQAFARQKGNDLAAAAAVVQPSGPVLIRNMTDWFLTACCKKKKNEHAHYVSAGSK